MYKRTAQLVNIQRQCNDYSKSLKDEATRVHHNISRNVPSGRWLGFSYVRVQRGSGLWRVLNVLFEAMFRSGLEDLARHLTKQRSGLGSFSHQQTATAPQLSVRYLHLIYRVILSVLDPRKCEYLKDYSLHFEHAYMTTYLASWEACRY